MTLFHFEDFAAEAEVAEEADDAPKALELCGKLYQKYAMHLESLLDDHGHLGRESGLEQAQTIIACFMYFTNNLDWSRCSSLQRAIYKHAREKGYMDTLTDRMGELSQPPFAAPWTASHWLATWMLLINIMCT